MNEGERLWPHGPWWTASRSNYPSLVQCLLINTFLMQKYDYVFFELSVLLVIKKESGVFNSHCTISLALCEQNLYEKTIFSRKEKLNTLGWIWQQTKVNPISQLDILNGTVNPLMLAILSISAGDSSFCAGNI